MSQLANIKLLATDLRLSHGTLLRLAREASENGSLVSLSHLTDKAQIRLLARLQEIEARECEMAVSA